MMRYILKAKLLCDAIKLNIMICFLKWISYKHPLLIQVLFLPVCYFLSLLFLHSSSGLVLFMTGRGAVYTCQVSISPTTTCYLLCFSLSSFHPFCAYLWPSILSIQVHHEKGLIDRAHTPVSCKTRGQCHQDSVVFFTSSTQHTRQLSQKTNRKSQPPPQ